ncbi:quinone oxidoreductase family protein [Enterovirga rhinocerotis]|uniref:NADPH2:quinone reductase n=1 Tax=Enterovirga rhinocerotis TaxID=1339210 RepID=A0A4R7C3U8_9HYPH|nr:quinone oxidoreductase [Enterovirga rhinocerotis]TDR93124.1 NADPH2:quinone reductase [Enterovirga rhinocerotis]
MVAAIRVHEHGGPEVLKYEEIELPPPGSGEIRVRQTAIGVNYIDTYFRTGLYKPPALPFIAGNEAAGEVTALGEGVSGFKVGDRVAYVVALGCYAAERNVPAAMALKLPEGVSDEVAAAAMLKGLTAEYLLHRTYKVKRGDTVLVHAAAGGVGLILGQWAKHLGATVIGTAGTEEKAELARRNGCDHVILYRKEGFAKRVAEITNGEKCHVVYDGVGKTTFEGSLDSLRPLGVLASFGNASGSVAQFDLGILGPKGSLFVTRPTLFTFIQKRAWLEEMASNLFGAISSGAVSIAINRRAKLKDAADIHRALEGRETTGAIVLTP